MKHYADPADKTTFTQSMMHLIKSNLGTGILAMPASFKHCGLLGALVGLPLLCLVATYCVHLLVRSRVHVESKVGAACPGYAELASSAFEVGPPRVRKFAGAMLTAVDLAMVVCQTGICCVYLVFIVDNVTAILASQGVRAQKSHLFLVILPATTLLSFIKTMRRLAILSTCANLLQVLGLSVVVEYLVREMPAEPKVEYFRSAPELALGFGSAMFAFEGIAVVLPVYTRMRQPERMSSLLGVINVSYTLLLALYMLVGLLGYLRFDVSAADSITLNLPREPLYDLVRAVFTASVLLSYPLQFYVLNEIIWGHLGPRLAPPSPGLARSGKAQEREQVAGPKPKQQCGRHARYENYTRAALVLATFVLAVTVPKLHLMMDFFGSISGTAFSITLPAIIHLVSFWESTSGGLKASLIISDLLIIAFGVVASANGSYFSLLEIVHSFSLDHERAAVANVTCGAS